MGEFIRTDKGFNMVSSNKLSKLEFFSHYSPIETVSHMNRIKGKRVYEKTLQEFRDMANGGDGGRTVPGTGGMSIRDYYYPHYDNQDFMDIIIKLGHNPGVT